MTDDAPDFAAAEAAHRADVALQRARGEAARAQAQLAAVRAELNRIAAAVPCAGQVADGVRYAVGRIRHVLPDPQSANPPGSTVEQLPAAVLAILPERAYTSTACETASLLESDVYGRARHWGLKLPAEVTLADLEEHIRRLHGWCSLNHEFTGRLCVCACHGERVYGVMADCRTCRGNRVVPDLSVPHEYGEPVPKTCPDCSGPGGGQAERL